MSAPIKCCFLEDTGRDTPGIPCDCGCGTTTDGRSIFRRTDTGDEMTLRDAPAGAMWFADWMLDGTSREAGDNRNVGPDGHYLVVRLPGNHDWSVDGRCSNCTLPGDNAHKCWVRHGEPPNVTVDKNGPTCQAGAGSIQVSGWHGFLRDGFLVEC